MAKAQKLQRFQPVFFGEHSKALWEDIRSVKKENVQTALYSLGSYCQELESIIVQLEERIAGLEKRRP